MKHLQYTYTLMVSHRLWYCNRIIRGGTPPMVNTRSLPTMFYVCSICQRLVICSSCPRSHLADETTRAPKSGAYEPRALA